MKQFIFTTLLLAGACSYSHAQKVVSGVNVANNSADFFCSLVDPGTPGVEPFCGSALIAPQWVLTAGHCTFDFNTFQTSTAIDVVIHPYYRNAPSGTYMRIHADTIIPHPNFDFMTGLEYDIALIRLETPVPNAQVLKLPTQGNTSLTTPGATAYVMGYGVFDTLNPGNQPDTLQMADIEVISNAVCNEPLRYNGAVMPSMLCAGKLTGVSKGGGAGDSGGPLYVNNGGQKTQIGVVSWGSTQFSTTTHPGVYTRVAAYRAWIDSVLGNEALAVPELPETIAPSLSQNGSQLVITFPENTKETMTYTIYNTAGQTLLKGDLEKGAVQAKIATENFANGLYLVHIQDSKGFSFAGKFMQAL